MIERGGRVDAGAAPAEDGSRRTAGPIAPGTTDSSRPQIGGEYIRPRRQPRATLCRSSAGLRVLPVLPGQVCRSEAKGVELAPARQSPTSARPRVVCGAQPSPTQPAKLAMARVYLLLALSALSLTDALKLRK